MTRRREFLGRVGVLGASVAGLALLEACGAAPTLPQGKLPLETTKLRIAKTSAICGGAQFVAEDFLRADGFEVEYVPVSNQLTATLLGAGEVDMTMQFSGPLIVRIDFGEPITILAGGHVGCFELFATERINAIRDLKGRPVAITGFGGPDHVFLSSMVAYVGMDPQRDIVWREFPTTVEALPRLVDGTIDALMAFPPISQEMRAKKIGHQVVNSMLDKPWAQYFCCMIAANSNFVRKNPTATKRALKAILRAQDVCAREPERAARYLVDHGYTSNYDYALQTMRELPYNVWREYDPEDTIRFYALRLNEAGMVKSTPQKIISNGADWRFLEELKKELPA